MGTVGHDSRKDTHTAQLPRVVWHGAALTRNHDYGDVSVVTLRKGVRREIEVWE